MRTEQTKKPKKIQDLLIAIAFFAVVGAIAYGIAWLLHTDPVPGDITVYSGETEVVMLQNVITEEHRKNGTTNYDRFVIEEDAEQFPVVQMDRSIMLEASQDPISDMYYSVYNADYSELYYRAVRFEYPEEAGTYYVVVDTMWGNRDLKFTTQHGFTLIIE